MTVLLGIVCFHLLVILRAKQSVRERPPYGTTFFLTALMVAFVVALMYTMQPPE